MPTALIIDDNRTNIVVLQQLLGVENVESVTISNTKDIASQLDEIAGVDVVFLDLEMPNISGYEALNIIRAHPQYQDARVVAYSVHVSELHNVFDMGFDAFLGKPLNAEEFPDHLQRILNGEKVSYLP